MSDTNNDDRSAEIRVKSLAKALELLNCFAQQPEYGVTELATKMNLQKSNVHNILVTFKAMGYLEQNADTGKYTLGTQMLELTRAVGDRFTVRRVAMPFMQELANTTHERVYLAVPQKDMALYLEAAYPAQDFSLSRSLMGVKAEMYCTAIGKAMMAFLPEGEAEAYASKELKPYTEKTITSKARLLEELQTIRRQGYAIDDMEHEFGVKCVAKPLFDRSGKICAAISISGPSLRFEDDVIQNYAQRLTEAANTIQERLL